MHPGKLLTQPALPLSQFVGQPGLRFQPWQTKTPRYSKTSAAPVISCPAWADVFSKTSAARVQTSGTVGGGGGASDDSSAFETQALIALYCRGFCHAINVYSPSSHQVLHTPGVETDVKDCITQHGASGGTTFHGNRAGRGVLSLPGLSRFLELLLPHSRSCRPLQLGQH